MAKCLATPGGRGDVSGLVVATLAGASGLILLASWLKDYERKRDGSEGPCEHGSCEADAVTVFPSWH